MKKSQRIFCVNNGTSHGQKDFSQQRGPSAQNYFPFFPGFRADCGWYGTSVNQPERLGSRRAALQGLVVMSDQLARNVEHDVNEAVAFAMAESKTRPELFNTLVLAYCLCMSLRRIEKRIL